MKREIKVPQRLPRMLAFKVDGTGTASITQGSRQATLTDNGTGDYTLTFAEAFKRAPVCVATCITAGKVAEIAASAVGSVQILTKTATSGAAADADFHLMVLGYDAADEI